MKKKPNRECHLFNNKKKPNRECHLFNNTGYVLNNGPGIATRCAPGNHRSCNRPP